MSLDIDVLQHYLCDRAIIDMVKARAQDAVPLSKTQPSTSERLF
jgi:hypothetical protein